MSLDYEHNRQAIISDLLAHNLPPTESQENFTRSSLLGIQSDIRSLDDEILRMRAALDGLLVRRVALCADEEAYKSVISPLRRLPAEVLAEIFTDCLPSFPFKYAAHSAPLVLEGVCRAWKDIARATPALWAYINLAGGYSSEIRNCAAMVSMWSSLSMW